jgi:nucleotide-binding universal stress UspA family protein
MNQAKATIVVGVDDTDAGRAALSFAMREASRRGSSLDVVTAWTARPAAMPHNGTDRGESDRARAQDLQDAAVAAVLRGMEGSPTISRQVVEGDAATVLLSMARTADYLVVGAGRGLFHTDGLLGSVTEQCVQAAGCPVLVVPRPQDATPTKG